MNDSNEADLIQVNTVIIFTKRFPYGHQETYLHNELSYLSKEFAKVIIIPYDEFSYKDEDCREIKYENIEVFKINKEVKPLTFFQKVLAIVFAIKILVFEVVKGREAKNHLKFFKRNFSQLLHSYACAVSLKKQMLSQKLNNVLLYNYWLHGGVIISNMLNTVLNKSYPIISRAHAYDVYHKDWYTLFPDSEYLFLGFETYKINHTDKIYPISTHAYNHFATLFPKYIDKFEIARLGVKMI